MKWDRKTILKRAIDVALVLAMVYVALLALGVVRRGGNFEAGAPAPDFRVRSIWDEREIRKDDLAGKVVVLNFFSTGCPACRRKLGDLVRLQEQGGDKVRILLVSGDPPGELRRYLEQEGIRLEAGLDISAAHRAFGASSIPYMVVMDPQGRIQADFIGGVRWSDLTPWLPD